MTLFFCALVFVLAICAALILGCVIVGIVGRRQSLRKHREYGGAGDVFW